MKEQTQIQEVERPVRHWRITIWIIIGGFFGVGIGLLISGVSFQTSVLASIVVPALLAWVEPEITDMFPPRDQLPPFLQRKLPALIEEKKVTPKEEETPDGPEEEKLSP